MEYEKKIIETIKKSEIYHKNEEDSCGNKFMIKHLNFENGIGQIKCKCNEENNFNIFTINFQVIIECKTCSNKFYIY